MMNKITKPIINLALCGGGIYGYAEVGSLSELSNYPEYFDFKNISGTSVGSIIASLYAVGYNPTELTKILFEMDFNKLICDVKLPYLNFYRKYGMYNADSLENEIERLITEKTNISNCTFSQIKCNLKIIATNLNYQCARVFDRENNPLMVVSKAVRMSIAFPVVIAPVLFEGDLYGDGGEFLNYPITLFNNLEQTLGICFAAYNENVDGTLKSRTNIHSIYDFLKSSGTTMNRAAYVSQIKTEHINRSIIINITENISSTQFSLSDEQKHFIYRCGVNAAKDQLDKILGLPVSLEMTNTLEKISESVSDICHSFEIIHS